MKFLIVAFALFVAVSARGVRRDVSEIVQGDGWYKDETGYHYTQPENRFDAPEAPAPEAPAPAPEEPIIEEVVVVEEPAQISLDAVAEVNNEYLPPVDYLPPASNDLLEYLPPKTEDAKRKRQIPVRKQVRRVYRRVVRRH